MPQCQAAETERLVEFDSSKQVQFVYQLLDQVEASTAAKSVAKKTSLSTNNWVKWRAASAAESSANKTSLSTNFWVKRRPAAAASSTGAAAQGGDQSSDHRIRPFSS